MYFLIVSNSPGELTGWVQPLAGALKQAARQACIRLVVPPCQYASGRELAVARGFPEIAEVLGPWQYARLLCQGRHYPFSRPVAGEPGMCIFLGGDPFHAVLVAKRLGIPLAGYLHTPRWKGQFDRYMVRDEAEKSRFLEQGVAPERICVVGDLMVDAFSSVAEPRKAWTAADTESQDVLLLPGSRPQIAENMIPFFVAASALLAEQMPQLRFRLLLSPFLEKTIFPAVDKAKIYQLMKVPRLQFKVENGQARLRTTSGLQVRVLFDRHREAMRSADLALTIPGTNTMELACAGVPMVVVLALNRPELVPFEGLAGLVGNIPGLGKMIKSRAIDAYLRRITYCALPNMRARRELVPEMAGKVSPEDVARVALALLRDEGARERMSEELQRDTHADRGATARFAHCCLQLMQASIAAD